MCWAAGWCVRTAYRRSRTCWRSLLSWQKQLRNCSTRWVGLLHGRQHKSYAVRLLDMQGFLRGGCPLGRRSVCCCADCAPSVCVSVAQVDHHKCTLTSVIAHLCFSLAWCFCYMWHIRCHQAGSGCDPKAVLDSHLSHLIPVVCDMSDVLLPGVVLVRACACSLLVTRM